jgi:hypothetical protein
VGSDGVKRLIGTKLLPDTPSVEISTPVGPPVGRYSVLVEGTRKGTDQKDQATVFVNITN